MQDNNFIGSLTAWLPELTYNVPLQADPVNFTPLLGALLIFLGLTAIFWLLRAIVLGRAEALAARTRGDFDDVFVGAIKSIKAWVYTLVALYLSLQFFSFTEWFERTLDAIFYFTLVWQGIAIASCFISYVVRKYLEKDEDGDGIVDPDSATASNLVVLISKIVLWALGGIFVLSNIGIEVTSLIAGLGIGGIAVAFALQGILSDLFASFSIYFDRPFRVGDFIVIGDNSGTVEKIGIKSTRLRTLQGEELVVSNAELTTARIQNFKKMNEREIFTKFGVTYETPNDKVELINQIVAEILNSIDGARLDRSHFVSFGDSALIFEVAYFIESAVYVDFLNIQQAFNFTLMKRFAEEGIEFAYPTQMIHHKTVS